MKGHYLNKPGRDSFQCPSPNATYRVPSFYVISLSVPEMKNFKSFIPYMYMMTRMPWTNFDLKPNWGSICNVVLISHAVLEKILKLLNLRDLGPLSVNDLDYWYL